MLEKMNKEQIEKTKQISENFRSKILIYAVGLEQILTSMIITRFTKNPLEMIDFIFYFEKTSFERKIRLVELILKSNYSNLLKESETTFTQLTQIRDIRNILSHYHSSFEYDDKKTVFVLSPNVVKITKDKKGLFVGKNVHKFTINKMIGLMKMVENCDSRLRELQRKIK